MNPGFQTSFFGNNNSSLKTLISDDIIFYIPKIIGELGFALHEGLNKTEIKSKFQKYSDSKIDRAIITLENLGYIVQKETENRAEKRYFLTLLTIQKLKEISTS